ncbi:MAG: T9SS type A sorting domain-containing protein [Candidatus Marinimicrobia bacterium]|nr:T9SS type A sorting domain-containing protein [Candidatus Neomarinimicrobiota bacterium]
MPEEKIIFIVDIVTPKRLAFTIMPDFSPKGWERTLIEVEKLDFDTAMFGQKKAFGPASEVKEIRLIVLNLLGQEVYNERTTVGHGNNQISIDLKNQTSGLYTLRLLSGNEMIISKKIILEK